MGLAASTKGNVLLQYFNIESSHLPKIGEINEDKYGCYTPGSEIPLVPEADVLNENPEYIMVLPWHYKEHFLGNTKFQGRKLVFPLPNLEIVEVT